MRICLLNFKIGSDPIQRLERGDSIRWGRAAVRRGFAVCCHSPPIKGTDSCSGPGGHSNNERSQRQAKSGTVTFSAINPIEVVKYGCKASATKMSGGESKCSSGFAQRAGVSCHQCLPRSHSESRLERECDWKAIHNAFHVFGEEWEPSLSEYPAVGLTAYRHPNWGSMPKIGYRATFWSNFPSLVADGLLRGGVTLGGSSGRTFE